MARLVIFGRRERFTVTVAPKFRLAAALRRHETPEMLALWHFTIAGRGISDRIRDIFRRFWHKRCHRRNDEAD
jgi:hypothetical protein